MKRILSGIKSSGDATLGNYLGAIKRWVELQPQKGAANENEYFYFVPNLHALTVRPDPAALHSDTLSNAAWLIAAGINPGKVTLFVQSQVSAHSELAWILNNYVTMGELSRMTQYKDKVAKSSSEGQLVGIFTYPALMAADILLYDANEVPVGDDQVQHVELTRDIASRFNNLYGQIFTIPEATVPEIGARIMNLQNPNQKMSKSEGEPSGTIMMADSPDDIIRKIKRAVTGSGTGIGSEDEPGISNLVQIFGAVKGVTAREITQEYSGKGYGDFKLALAEALVDHLQPIQQRHSDLMKDQSKLLAIINDGSEKARRIADEKLAQIKQAIGLF
jgi:tryptophanyl-tRNA synthetase